MALIGLISDFTGLFLRQLRRAFAVVAPQDFAAAFVTRQNTAQYE
jgi:hypothetical protein